MRSGHSFERSDRKCVFGSLVINRFEKSKASQAMGYVSFVTRAFLATRLLKSEPDLGTGTRPGTVQLWATGKPGDTTEPHVLLFKVRRLVSQCEGRPSSSSVCATSPPISPSEPLA